METFRNKFVIRQESGHPGYRSTTIVATREDLAALADEIKKKLADGYQPPFVSHYATDTHGQSSRVYLQFEPATEKELDGYHQTKKPLGSWIVRAVMGLIAVALVIIGGLRVWHWLVTGVW